MAFSFNFRSKFPCGYLYLFKKGNWESLLNNRLFECDCSIENREDKLYIVKWQRAGKDVAVIGNGDYAISETMNLQNIAKSIRILTNGKQIPEYRAENVDIINKEIKEVNRK